MTEARFPGLAVRKGYADIADGQVHYAQVAGDGAPIVFIHKTVSTYRMWLPVMAALPAGHAMIAFDTPGFGESFDPAEPVDMPQYAAWIGESMRALGIGPAHVVGHHTGAAIALELAVMAPELFLSVGLIGPLPLSSEERAESAEKYGTAFAPRAGGGHMLDALAYIVGAGADSVELQNREMSAMLRSWQTRSWTYDAVWRQDHATLLKEVTVPLALQCAPDDSLWPVFQRACDLRPDALAITLSGGKNYETDIVPAEVADAIVRQIAFARSA
jgi:pimeloyl-ACP methyl ester carboxylesterase